jgi:hypothetical protein
MAERLLRIGLAKDYERFVFFEIVDAPTFRKALEELVPMITGCVKAQKDRSRAKNRSRKSERFHIGAINIAFSFVGLEKVSSVPRPTICVDCLARWR